ncbi:MAG: hypothetical protein ACHQFZ_01720 [Acidimicrobiales bacterium]
MSRGAQLSGAKGFEWARSMRDRVTDTLGHEVQLWARALSPGFGTVSWTSWWEDLTSMENAFAKLAVDAKYAEAAAAGREHITGSVDDTLTQSITGVPPASGTARYVGSIQAVVAQGNGVRAFGAGVEIAEKAAAISGAPTMFVQRLTGPYGAVGWFSAFENLGHFESASAKLAADPGFATFLDSLKGCFVEGSGQSLLWMKID